jgi:hypothetical protein
MGLLNISFPWQMQVQEETAIISWRECSKMSVQSCPEPAEGKAANGLLGPAGPHGLVHPEG